jgi:hypothetical protein
MRKLIVTQEIIDKAIEFKAAVERVGNCYLPSRNCPIALAGREIGLSSSGAVSMEVTDESRVKMSNFICNFDNGLPVEPIELELLN